MLEMSTPSEALQVEPNLSIKELQTDDISQHGNFSEHISKANKNSQLYVASHCLDISYTSLEHPLHVTWTPNTRHSNT